FFYVSPSFPGGAVDVAVARETLQCWYPQLEEDEYGFADGGFDGLSAQGLRIITPTTKRDDPLYSAQSHFRILIEQRIGDLKDWRACKEQWRSPITEDSKEEHHRVYVVVAAILNLFNTRK